jgi:RNA polymerase sigma-70 factor (ECF subfamily)
MVRVASKNTFQSFVNSMNNDNSDASKRRVASASEAASLAPPANDDDVPLVERALQGQAEAFEALFLKHRQRVFSVAWRLLRNEDAALDVVQDAFVRAYEGLDRLRGDGRFFPWLRRIAINLAIDRLRHTRRGVDVSLEYCAVPNGEDEETPLTARVANPDAEDPVEAAELSEFKSDFARAVERLSEPQRTAFLLSAEGLSYKEIAAATECNIGTVMSRLFYARKQLQESLKVHLKV